MEGAWKELDRILRGEATRPTAMRAGTIELPVGRLAGVLVALALVYGLCMGTYAVFRAGGPYYWQLIASTVKLPLLFGLTLLVTFPSLYVFNALVGSRLTMPSLLRLLVAALSVTLAVLASFGPIVAFFSVSTTSHPFMLLLNVVVCAAGGFLGLKFLLLTLHRLSIAQEEALQPVATEADRATGTEVTVAATDPLVAAEGSAAVPRAIRLPARPDPAGALDRLDGRVLGPHVTTVFRIWVIVFGLVGAQMSWVLRPFIGTPGVPFEWFRARESSFFEAVWKAFIGLFS